MYFSKLAIEFDVTLIPYMQSTKVDYYPESTTGDWREGADRMASARDCALGAAILGGQVGYRSVGGPWWAEFALAALGLLTVCLRIVFPQDSPDKLALWRDRRRTGQHDRRRRTRGRAYKRRQQRDKRT
jgi:hypothetical protein